MHAQVTGHIRLSKRIPTEVRVHRLQNPSVVSPYVAFARDESQPLIGAETLTEHVRLVDRQLSDSLLHGYVLVVIRLLVEMQESHTVRTDLVDHGQEMLERNIRRLLFRQIDLLLVVIEMDLLDDFRADGVQLRAYLLSFADQAGDLFVVRIDGTYFSRFTLAFLARAGLLAR